MKQWFSYVNIMLVVGFFNACIVQAVTSQELDSYVQLIKHIDQALTDKVVDPAVIMQEHDIIQLIELFDEIKAVLPADELEDAKKAIEHIRSIILPSRAPRMGTPEIHPTTIVDPNYYRERDEYLRDLTVTGSLIAPGFPSNIVGGPFLPLAGGTMTGDIVMSNQTGIVFEDAGNTASVTIQAPATITPVSYVLNLPVADGTPNQALVTDGAGNLSWSSAVATSSGIQSINMLTAPDQFFTTAIANTAPEFVEVSSTTHQLQIPLASTPGVTAGLISNNDYNTFNMKLSTTGGTVTGPLILTSTLVLQHCNEIIFNNADDSGSVTLKAPCTTNDNFMVSLQLPTTQGQVGQVLGQSPLGQLTWITTATCNTNLLCTATPADVPGTLVLRDGTGSFAATNITVTGQTIYLGANGGTISLSAPAVVSTYALTLPGTGPTTTNQALLSDGMGGLMWTAVQTSTLGIQSINTLTDANLFLITTTGCNTLVPKFNNTSSNTIDLNIPMAACAGTLAGLISNADYVNFSNTYTTVINATSCDTPGALVSRDANGNIAVGTLTLTTSVPLLNYQNSGTCPGGETLLSLPASTTLQFGPAITSVLPGNNLLTNLGAGGSEWSTVNTGTLVLYDGSGNSATLASPTLYTNGSYSLTMPLTSAPGQYQVLGNISAPGAAEQLGWITTATCNTNLLCTATPADVPNTLVLRDGTGSFASTNVTLTGCLLLTDSNNQLAGTVCANANALIVAPQVNRALQTTAAGNVRGINAVDLQINNNGTTSVASGNYSFIGAGQNNTASGNYSVVAGGSGNTASGLLSFVGAGGTLGLGNGNQALGQGSVVVGGSGNTASNVNAVVVGGQNNSAFGSVSFVGGGSNNSATGIGASILGGSANQANGDFSVALGRNAIATGTGSFVFADSQFGTFSSAANDTFNIRAQGGLVLSGTQNAGTVTVRVANPTVSYGVILPDAQATGANQALLNDGFGNLTWQTVATSTLGIQSINTLTDANLFLITTTGCNTLVPKFNNTSSNTIDLNIPMAACAGTLAGLISNADYVNFSNTYTTVINATSCDTPGTLVSRDANGNIAVGTLTLTTSVPLLNYQNSGTCPGGETLLSLPASTTLQFGSAITSVIPGNNLLTNLGAAGSEWSTVNTGTLILYDRSGNSATLASPTLYTNGSYSLTMPLTSAPGQYQVLGNISAPGAAEQLGWITTATCNTNLLCTATPADVPGTLVLRDGTGSFAATNITVTGQTIYLGANGGTISLSAPAVVSTYALTLPGTGPTTTNQALLSNGMGGLMWQTVATSTLGIQSINTLTATNILLITTTGCNTTIPRYINSGNTIDLNIPMAACAGTLAGLISNADYVNFINTETTVAAATSCDTPGTLVSRDSNGNIAVGTLTLTTSVPLLNYQNSGTCPGGETLLSLPASTTLQFGSGITSVIPGTDNTASLGSVTDRWSSVNTFTTNYFDTAGHEVSFELNPVAAGNVSYSLYWPQTIGAANNVLTTAGGNPGQLQWTPITTILSGTVCDFPNTIVARDGTGSFVATTISLTGNSLIDYGSNGNPQCLPGTPFILAPQNGNTIISLFDTSTAPNTATIGGNNTAFGHRALAAITTGTGNTAIGVNALAGITTGSNNVALGANAGASYTGAESNNIVIDNAGVAGDSNTIRIGTQGSQTSAYIAGIYPNTIAGSFVTINSSGELGISSITTLTSSSSCDIPNTLVIRDGNGSFAATTITLTSQNLLNFNQLEIHAHLTRRS